MKPAMAKSSDESIAFDEIGRATLQIVHDLKNQLNGLKLYATYLRKRLEREDRTPEERETLAKLIAGLDRAAKDMTALVQYARPLDMRKQSPVDLAKIVSDIVTDIGARETGGLPPMTIATEIDAEAMLGEFDPTLIAHAITAITYDIRSTVRSKGPNALSINMRRETHPDMDEALIEWQGSAGLTRQHSFSESIGCGTVHTALGAKIIEAHGGRVNCDASTLRAWLPLIQSNKEHY